MSDITTKDHPTVRGLLAAYDRGIHGGLLGVAAAVGTERVQRLAALRRMVSVHDGVLTSALAPLLDDLPEGSAVAGRLRAGCAERAEALRRFQELSDGVAAPDVYPVSGREVDRVVEELAASFARHEHDETVEVARVLEASATSRDPDVLAARMALATHLAPTRAHPDRRHGPRPRLLRRAYHYVDAWHDWNDTHHGWRLRPPERSR